MQLFLTIKKESYQGEESQKQKESSLDESLARDSNDDCLKKSRKNLAKNGLDSKENRVLQHMQKK